MCVGYLSSEHARVARYILRHSNHMYRVVETPDFQPFYETPIQLQFDIPSQLGNKILDRVNDVCGHAFRIPTTVMASFESGDES